MTNVEDITAARRDLDRRRSLAMARDAREGERAVAIERLAALQEKARRLRTLIAAYEGSAEPVSELDRMLAWVRAELGGIDAELDPVRLAESLAARRLFPADDPLADPQGEPRPKRPWGA